MAGMLSHVLRPITTAFCTAQRQRAGWQTRISQRLRGARPTASLHGAEAGVSQTYLLHQPGCNNITPPLQPSCRACLAGSAVRLVSSLKYFMSPGRLHGRLPPAQAARKGGVVTTTRQDAAGKAGGAGGAAAATATALTLADAPALGGSHHDLECAPSRRHAAFPATTPPPLGWSLQARQAAGAAVGRRPTGGGGAGLLAGSGRRKDPCVPQVPIGGPQGNPSSPAARVGVQKFGGLAVGRGAA